MASDDEFEGIFDTLTPEDFMDQTTCFKQVGREHYNPRDPFDDFVKRNLQTLEVAYAASEGDMNPPAVLANQKIERMFLPTDDETVRTYLDRLHEEARSMSAKWLFIARRTQVAAQLVPSDKVDDVTMGKTTKDAIEAGALEDGVFWYAECREGEEILRRAGIYINQDDVLVTPVEGPPNSQPVAIFEGILG